MIENTQNSIEGYIGLFTIYIIPINYSIVLKGIFIFSHFISFSSIM